MGSFRPVARERPACSYHPSATATTHLVECVQLRIVVTVANLGQLVQHPGVSNVVQPKLKAFAVSLQKNQN